mmetsp:Transcript_12458/g.46085  ORF Transcript_12458/g.46085 Transcript_12458/m.46085 type:complete len:110 (-) Transcript_12458:110-439(-)
MWHLLWYPAGLILGISFAAIAFASFPFGDPLDAKNWWHCMTPCASTWHLLQTSFCYTTSKMLLRDGDDALVSPETLRSDMPKLLVTEVLSAGLVAAGKHHASSWRLRKA